METSAELCRAQIAHHRNIAESALLANVREIAANAEKAWERLAQMAEKRDATRAIARRPAGAMRTGEAPLPVGVDENPDRDHADA